MEPEPPLITPILCRAARALLDWDQNDLASAAGVGLATVQDFETGKRTPRGGTLLQLGRAFEKAGVSWHDTPDDCGLTLRKHR